MFNQVVETNVNGDDDGREECVFGPRLCKPRNIFNF